MSEKSQVFPEKLVFFVPFCRFNVAEKFSFAIDAHKSHQDAKKTFLGLPQ